MQYNAHRALFSLDMLHFYTKIKVPKYGYTEARKKKKTHHQKKRLLRKKLARFVFGF
jgi:hypothetical protein